jgi:hypothetical protein
VINHQTPHEFGGQVLLRYALTGVCAPFVIPARHGVEADTPQRLESGCIDLEMPTTAVPLSGYDILLVEDSLLISLDTESMLWDAGAVRVEVAASAAEALTLISSKT